VDLDKAQVARRQLGAALALFIDDLDPVSVHCLACGGGEVAETLTERAGKNPFSAHAMEVVPDLTRGKLREMRNRYWNAFKHALDHRGVDRQDAATLAEFDDAKNDHVLFIGWYDLMLALGRMPIEAQAFQAWYFAKYPEKLDPEYDAELYDRVFPGLREMERRGQKAFLRTVIAEHRLNLDVMDDPKTDRDALILGLGER
jgi:hypothetical protein